MVINGKPTSYDILINEEQRLELIKILKASGIKLEEGPLEYWVEILEELPKHELETPNVTHGLCL